jgi:hypothetical protein
VNWHDPLVCYSQGLIIVIETGVSRTDGSLNAVKEAETPVRLD